MYRSFKQRITACSSPQYSPKFAPMITNGECCWGICQKFKFASLTTLSFLTQCIISHAWPIIQFSLSLAVFHSFFPRVILGFFPFSQRQKRRKDLLNKTHTHRENMYINADTHTHPNTHTRRARIRQLKKKGSHQPSNCKIRIS